MSDYCELPEFFNEKIPKAKKDYVCCECGQTILAGTLYWYCIGKWAGEMGSYRQHIECRDACYTFQDHYPGECIGFGQLREEMGNSWGFEAWEWMGDDQRLREKCDHEKECRSFLAQGLKASRLKPHQIQEYNKRHEHRRNDV